MGKSATVQFDGGAATYLGVGIYGFWVMPRVTKWIVENTDFDDAGIPTSTPPISVAVT
jgi:hypothetical protein